MSRAGLWSLACGIWLLTDSSAAAAPPSDEGDQPAHADASDVREQAKSAAKLGSTAFRAGEYATAIKHFGEATALRDAPKLHYNIAVCHHRLMMAAADEDTRLFHNDQAIEAYNGYLERKPDAADRDQVAQTVRQLGGTPVRRGGLKSAFEGLDDVVEEEDTLALPSEGDEPAGAPDESEDPAHSETAEATEDSEDQTTTGDEAAAKEAKEPKPPRPPHARFYFGPHLGTAPQLAGNRSVAGVVSIMADLKASALIGKERQHAIGLDIGWWGSPGDNLSQLAFATASVSAAYDYELGLGADDKWVMSFGAAIGGSRQTIRTTAAAAPPRCAQRDTDGALREDGRLVGARLGGAAALRFNVGRVFGRRKWHEVNFSLHPQIAAYGNGAPSSLDTGELCTGSDEFVFDALDVPNVLVGIFGGFGYAFRF